MRDFEGSSEQTRESKKNNLNQKSSKKEPKGKPEFQINLTSKGGLLTPEDLKSKLIFEEKKQPSSTIERIMNSDPLLNPQFGGNQPEPREASPPMNFKINFKNFKK